MRIAQLFNTLTLPFAASKKSQSTADQTTGNSNGKLAGHDAGTANRASDDAHTLARLALLHTAQRKRADAARGRLVKHLQSSLPEVPTHAPELADPAEISRHRWLEQNLPSVPTHSPTSLAAKAPDVLPRSASHQTLAARRLAKLSKQKLIAHKRSQLTKVVEQRKALLHEINDSMAAAKTSSVRMSPADQVALRQKAKTLISTANAGRLLLREIHSLEKKLRAA